MNVKYMKYLDKHSYMFERTNRPLSGYTNSDLEKTVHYYNGYLPDAYKELLALGGNNFFEVVGVPVSLSGVEQMDILQNNLTRYLKSLGLYAGDEIAINAYDDNYWIIKKDEQFDDPIVFKIYETEERIEQLSPSLSKLVETLIDDYKRFYKIK